MEAVVFRDAADLFVTELATDLAGQSITVGVHGEVPNPRPTEFVRVVRLGGPRSSIVSDRQQLVYETWSTDDLAASELAAVCRALLLAMDGRVIDGTQVYRIDELSGPSSDPDPDSGQARYSGQFAAMFRGSPLG